MTHHQVIENQTLTFTGSDHHYGDTFLNCRLVLQPGAEPQFFHCYFGGCNFDPPLPAKGFGAWSGMFWFTQIDVAMPDDFKVVAP